MSELDVQLAGKSLADYTNTQLRLALGAVLYTNTADMWRAYLEQQGYTGSVADMLAKYYIDNNVPAQFRNYINAGLYLFTPRQLFLDGSKGVIFDNADLSSFYLDSAGATPATVNGLVGLQLDKSGNLALGAEVIPQPLDLTTGWTTVGTLSAVVVDGFTNTSGAGAGRSLNITTARWYRVTVTYTKSDSSTLFGVYDGSSANTINASTASSGTLSGTYLATGAVYLRLGGNASVTITSMTLKEVAGNHRYQTTTGSKPVLRGTPIGSNLVTNGDFASDVSGWTAASGGSISWASGKMRVTNGGGGRGTGEQAFTTVIGKVYRVRFSATAGTSPSAFFGVAQGSGPASVIVGVSNSLGTDFYFTAVGTTSYVYAQPNFTTAGLYIDVDNIEIHDVSAGSVTAPYGLQYDGVDDFMQTAAVDFTATDKMFVCAGARVLGSASTAIFVEFGPSVGGNAGTFYISVPETSNNIGHRVRGSLAGGTGSVSGYTAPYTRVLSLIGDIAGDVNTLRANGADIGTSAVDQGTGNFINTVLYFGRRAGTSLPYNGLDFGLVICGKTLTSNQISSTERYIAQRTGIAL